MTDTLLTAKRSDSHGQYYMLVFIDREQDVVVTKMTLLSRCQGKGTQGGRTWGEDGAMLPFLFWRVSIERRRSLPSGAAEVSRGEPGVIPGCARGDPSPVSHPGVLPRAPT